MKVGYIIASNEVMKNGKPIGYFYREQPDEEDDSGWRVFSGEESQEYVDNPDNFFMYNASTIVKFEPAIAQYLGYEYPTAFERDTESGGFVEIREN